MGAAAYVGRVGGLAVALGVGSAVFAGAGVAWADEADSPASKSPTAATPEDNTKDTTEADDKTTETQQDTDDDADEADSEEAEQEPEGSAEAEDSDESEDPDPEPTDGDASEDPEQDPAPQDADEAEPEDAPEPEDGDGPEETPAPEPDPEEQQDDTTPTTTTTPTSASNPAKNTAEDVEELDDPAVAPKEPAKVAVFADATTLAAATTTTISPQVAALLSGQQEPVKKPNLITAVVNVVTSMIDWAHQKAVAGPDDPPQPPFLWALLSFARRELENLFAARSTSNAARSATIAPTSLALALGEAQAAALAAPNSPWLSSQVSPSTNFVSWVTGQNADTLGRFWVYGTDVGVMWDNGIPDDPKTPLINEHQVLIAVGDSFANAAKTLGWRYNTLFRSSDTYLPDGMTIPDGQWKNGNMFGGAPLSSATTARPIINRPTWLPNSVTLIPTAGISLPSPITKDAPYGATQYVSFMSVSNWGTSGKWTTNYSAIAYSTDNGENFSVAPESVRYNSSLSGNKNFQQSAFVKGKDGYVYVYGTPNGRQGAAYVARVAEKDILNVSKYEYFKAASSGWFGSTTPAKWVKGSPSSASAVIGKTGGSCGATKPGYSVSEMSVQYNEYLKKYVVLYGDQFNNVVMRTSDTPQGKWSDAKILMTQQAQGIYAPMLHPWSPSTQGTGSDLYWNLSLWSDYNVVLMRTDLTKI